MLLTERERGEILRLREFAQRMGYSINTVYKKIQRKELERWLIIPAEGGHKRIDWASYQRDCRKTGDLRKRVTALIAPLPPLSAKMFLPPLGLGIATTALMLSLTKPAIVHPAVAVQSQSAQASDATDDNAPPNVLIAPFKSNRVAVSGTAKKRSKWHKHQFIYQA